MDYCSLSLLNRASYLLLQSCIFCLATLRNQRKRWVIQTKMQLHRNNNPTKWSIKHGVNVIHSICSLIRANESRNTQFIKDPKMLEALLVLADYSYLASAWNWIPLSCGSIRYMWQRRNEALASCESKRAFEMQWLFGWKRAATTRKGGLPDGECYLEKWSTQNVMEERRMKRNTKSRLRSADWDWGVPNLGWGAPMGIEERPY